MTPGQISILLEAQLLKDLQEEISNYTKLTYQVTDKKVLEPLKKHLRELNQRSDRIHAERIRREAGLT